MTNQYLTKQTKLLGTVQVSQKRGICAPEEKSAGKDIKGMKRNMLKASSVWINHNIRREILNYYYSVDNGTWLFD